ncbi:hypothetical protein [Neobacillus novalis]|nr:hypothetical protein [Neobacillus novalis]
MVCKVCQGVGLLRDDEGWQYECSVCHGFGKLDGSDGKRETKIMSVDENNRLLD